MDVKFCRRCDKVRYSPCGIVCHASNDQAAQEKAIIALHERDMRARANDQGPAASDGNDRRYA